MAEKNEESSIKIVSCRQNKSIEVNRLNPIAKALLQGIYDDGCELSKLRGMWGILRNVWRYLTRFWKEKIKLTDKNPFERKSREQEEALNLVLKSSASYLNVSAFRFCYDHNGLRKLVRDQRWREFYQFENSDDPDRSNDSDVCYMLGIKIRFPEPTGINIDMMPFIMDVERFEKCQLPGYLKIYWERIIQKCHLGLDEIGKIGYLTIQESHVNKGETQRRPGIHTERPGIVKFQQNQGSQNTKESGSTEADMKDVRIFENGESVTDVGTFGWGVGEHIIEEARLKGGIYMISNTSDSCKLYNCEIMDDRLIGELGDIEHLREFLPPGEVMEKDTLYWFTDRTPHEALPLKEGTHRQFFHLVTSQVSLWYIDHSTKNPMGVVPDLEITKIVMGSKFDKKGVILVENANASICKQ